LKKKIILSPSDTLGQFQGTHYDTHGDREAKDPNAYGISGWIIRNAVSILYLG
jgi:hypothetical protein